MFLETPRFPECISYGSSGGPGYSTSVIVLASGYERRNANWEDSRHQYDVAYGIKDQDNLQDVISYFHVAQGRAHGFRYKDWLDFTTGATGDETPTALDQLFGPPDGILNVFQLVKTYVQGSSGKIREIRKPISGTVLVAVNSVTQTETTDYSIDYTTGEVTFVVTPLVTDVLSWGGEFDVPVRFDTDQLSTQLEEIQLGSQQIPLIEIRV